MAICERERGFSLIDTASVFEKVCVCVHERERECFSKIETYSFSTDRQL